MRKASPVKRKRKKSRRQLQVVVTPGRRAGKWTLSCVFDTQGEGWKACVALAKVLKCEAVLMGRDGKIRRKDSFGHDPEEIQG